MAERGPSGPEPIQVDPGRLRRLRPVELMVRFGFGALVGLGAGVVGHVAGPLAGGLFLAFPSVLPASLTLIEEKEGDRQARVDAAGAVLGAIGMIGFAVVVLLVVRAGPSAAALLLGTAGWLVASFGLFLVSRGTAARRVFPG